MSKADPYSSKAWVISRAILLRILIRDVKDSQYDGLVDTLVQRDPENGMSWILLAEKAWNHGQFKECLLAGQKAFSSPRFTLYEWEVRRRAAEVLQANNLLDEKMMRTLGSLFVPDIQNEMYLRHITLLSSLDTLQKLRKLVTVHRNCLNIF